MTQAEVLERRKGWAIEVRLCAEDPAKNFMPQIGTVQRWQIPQGEGMRVDHGLHEGQVLTPYYDSLLGKLIAHGESRDAARKKLIRMLSATVLDGVVSNREFLTQLLAHPAFAGGDFSTGFIAQHFPAPAPRPRVAA